MNSQKVHTFKGFEIFFNRAKMEAKMQSWTFITLFFLHLVVFIFVWNLNMPDGAMGYLIRHIIHDAFGQSDAYPRAIEIIVYYLKRYVFFTSSVYLLYPLVLWQYRKIAQKYLEPRHIRGARLIEVAELKRQLKREDCNITLGEVPVPRNIETQHFLILGKPGSGKTVCLSSVIEKLSGQKGVVYDFKGDYTERFFREDEDLLFNPLDSRCLPWNIFSDIHTVADIEAISHSLIPPGQSTDTEKYFSDAARAVLTGIIRHCISTGRKTNRDLWQIVSSPVSRIAEILSRTTGGEKGYVHIQDAASKQAMGVHSTLMQYAQALEYMQNLDGDFSVSEFVRSDRPGFIYITNYSDLRDTIRPILSLFIDLVSRKLLALSDDLNRRFYFVVDEFGTLQRLSSIVQLLTLSRSKGGSVFLGIQDIGQVDKLYGKELRQAISNACGSSVMFSVADPETAKFLSEKVGEREISEVEESQSMGPEDMRDGISLSRRKRVEKLLLPSQFLDLPNLHAYVKLPGYDVVKTRFVWKHYPHRAEPIMLRPDLIL